MEKPDLVSLIAINIETIDIKNNDGRPMKRPADEFANTNRDTDTDVLVHRGLT